PFHAVAMPHDDPPPIHGTGGASAGSRKLRAERNLGRICKSRDASRSKSIGKASVCRTEGTQFETKSSVDPGKQQEEEHDKRPGLEKKFARRRDRRADRTRRRSAR